MSGSRVSRRVCAATPFCSHARCSAAIPTARRDRLPFPSQCSAAVPEGTMVRRAGAKAGDRVFVSGTIGDATLGLMMRKGKDWNLAEEQRPTSCFALLAATAAQCAGRGRAHPRLGGNGHFRWSCRRFCQALPRVWCGGHYRRAHVCLSRMRPKRLPLPNPRPSNPSLPAATITRLFAPCRRPRRTVSARQPGKWRGGYRDRRNQGGRGRSVSGRRRPRSYVQADVFQSLLRRDGHAARGYNEIKERDFSMHDMTAKKSTVRTSWPASEFSKTP